MLFVASIQSRSEVYAWEKIHIKERVNGNVEFKSIHFCNILDYISKF